MSDEKFREFQSWWADDKQSELRQSCAEGWAYATWQASRESLVVDLRNAYRKGWDASSEGHNAEYPGNRHELESWNKKRDEDLGLRVKP